MIKIKKLDCGIRIAMEKMSHVQSAALGIWVKAGATDEEADRAGISHFIEHMMFKGTDKRNAKQIAEDADRIGGQINAFTGKEATCYYIKTLSSNIDKAADILLDMFLNSKFETKEMNKERSVICEEIKMIEDSPEDCVHDMIVETVFKGNPLAKSIIGTPTSLKKISRNTIVSYIENEYTKDSIVVSVAGNFDEDEICAIFEDKMKHLRESKEKKADSVEEYSPIHKVKIKDVEQTQLCLAVRGLPINDENYYALVLLSNIMGGSMSSRLFQNIREDKGLAYSVYSSFSSFSKTGYYNIYAGISHDKIKEAIEAIKQELNVLNREHITKDELVVAKEQLKANYIFGQENVNGRMFAIGKNTTILGRVYEAEEVIQDIDKVCLADIVKVSELISKPENYCGALITNKKFDLKKAILG